MNNFSLYNNRFPLLKLKNGKFILFNPWTSELFAAKRKTAFSKLKLARKKFVPHRRRYAPFFPKIAICLGYKCNLRCKYCYVYGGENKEETITRDILFSAFYRWFTPDT